MAAFLDVVSVDPLFIEMNRLMIGRKSPHLIRAALILLSCLIGPSLHAEILITVSEIETPQGRKDVRFVGSGSVDLTDLTFFSQVNLQGSDVGPQFASLTFRPDGALGVAAGYVGASNGTPGENGFDVTSPILGPQSFGVGFFLNNATTIVSTTGDEFYLDAFGSETELKAIGVPDGYISNSPLSFSMTVEDASFDSIGLTLGEYVYTWGTDNPDSLTIRIQDALQGDFDGDGDVDVADVDQYIGNLGATTAGDLLKLDLDGDGVITLEDHDDHVTRFLEAGGVMGTQLGDINLDGKTDVLGDAFLLVSNLGQQATSRSQGDLNADGVVNVLGDAFRLVNTLGQSNQPSTPVTANAIPGPNGMLIVALSGAFLN